MPLNFGQVADLVERARKAPPPSPPAPIARSAPAVLPRLYRRHRQILRRQRRCPVRPPCPMLRPPRRITGPNRLGAQQGIVALPSPVLPRVPPPDAAR